MNALELGDTTWSLGMWIGVPLTIVLVLIGLAAIVVGLLMWKEDGAGFFLAGGVVWLVVVLGIALSPLGFYPYHSEYHQWRELGGTLTQVDKRLISTDNGMEDKFVVRFAGSSQQYGCDDTRCAGIHVGDYLALSCKRAWQYTGTDGYDCRFVATEPAS